MLKVSSFLTDTPSQSLLPLSDLIDSSINDAVIKVAPFLNRSFKWSTPWIYVRQVSLIFTLDIRIFAY